MKNRGLWWTALLGLGAVLHLWGLRFAMELRAQLMPQLALEVAAGLCWLGALLVIVRGGGPAPERGSAAERRILVGLLVLALGMRLPALLPPLGHSDDVYRYLWDGAVQAAGKSPYLGPPDDPAYSEVARAHPRLHDRINHRHLPTIYPPSAQGMFRAFAAQLGAGTQVSESAIAAEDVDGEARRWRLLMGGFDLLILLLLLPACRRHDVRLWAVWAGCPLPATELWLNGHLEALGIAPLVGALLFWQRLEMKVKSTSLSGLDSPEPRGAGAFAIGALTLAAALVKPVALAPLPALSRLSARARAMVILGALIATAAYLAPYRGDRGRVLGSLGEYGRRWRSNDGAYALVHGTAEVAVKLVYRPPYYEPWKRPWLAKLITGRARDTVWPDELAAALARGAVAAALLGLAAFCARQRLRAEQTALALLFAYQLLSPTLHPWYELWPLGVVLLLPPGPWTRTFLPGLAAMVALAPLGYLPLPAYWRGEPWHEAIWPRLLQHVPGWIGMLGLMRLLRTVRSDRGDRAD